MLDGAEIVVVAYGTAGRIVQTAIKQAREEGIAVGLFRPISMFPFPYESLDEATEGARQILVVELSAGQMIEDVRLATRCRVPISFFGKMGGIVPLPEDILEEIRKLA
jgi:2-oxoglutarate ferredoxin oxidoreductase subunit alpha